MMPITRQQIEVLLDTPDQHDYVLSVYLDMTARKGLERPLEQALEKMAREAEAALATAPARKHLGPNLAMVRELVANEAGSSARGLAVFVSEARGFREKLSLDFPVEDYLVIDEEPFVLPLLINWHDRPTFLVVLLDSNEARLFEKFLGRPQPVADLDRQDAAERIQRDKPRFTVKKRFAATRHERLQGLEDAPFLREISGAIVEQTKGRDFAGLILLGPAQDTAALLGLLPRELADRVIGQSPCAMTGTIDDLDELATHMVEGWQARRWEEAASELIARQEQDHLVARGAVEVLDALQQGRAVQVLFGTRRDIPGAHCPDCGYRFGAPVGTCPYCEGRCESVNAAQDILRMALRQRVPVLFYHGPLLEDPLNDSGSVAALLRARENWAPANVGVLQEEREHAATT